jgi:hypothetical protein
VNLPQLFRTADIVTINIPIFQFSIYNSYESFDSVKSDSVVITKDRMGNVYFLVNYN